MPQIRVSILGRNYAVACGEGEEERLRQLAAYLQSRLGTLTPEQGKAAGKLSETHLVVLAGLMTADELFETREEVQKLKRAVKDAEEAVGAEKRRTENEQNALITALEQAAKRIERLTGLMA